MLYEVITPAIRQLGRLAHIQAFKLAHLCNRTRLIRHDFHLDDRAGMELAMQIFLGIGCDYPTFVDNQDALADGFDLLKNMGGKQNRMPIGQLRNQFTYLPDLKGIESHSYNFV